MADPEAWTSVELLARTSDEPGLRELQHRLAAALPPWVSRLR